MPKQSREYSSSSSEAEEVEWSERIAPTKSDGNDWLDLIDKNCTKNVKNNRKLDEKRDQELKNQKIRNERELNPYMRSDGCGSDARDERLSDQFVGPVRRAPIESTCSSGVSLKERNAINAKLLKAELMGNQSLVKELKEQLRQLENSETSVASSSGLSDDNRSKEYYSVTKRPNEESMSLKEMFLREKQTTAEDENRRFVATASKSCLNKDLDSDFDRVFDGEKTSKKRRHEKNVSKVNYMRHSDDRHCRQCVDNIDKQLVLSIGEKTVITLTPFEPFVKRMCHIISRSHSEMSTISSDEECLAEINERKHQISKYFSKRNRSVVFMETYFKRSRVLGKHFTIECIPIKNKYQNESKIFFKKAIMECESEWAMNRQVIQIKDKPIDKMIPKGLSYFWVTFGAKNDGFAHVIEDEDKFSPNFGKEVIGGLLDIEPNKWLKPKRQDYEQQYERVVKLKKEWNQMFSSNH